MATDYAKQAIGLDSRVWKSKSAHMLIETKKYVAVDAFHLQKVLPSFSKMHSNITSSELVDSDSTFRKNSTKIRMLRDECCFWTQFQKSKQDIGSTNVAYRLGFLLLSNFWNFIHSSSLMKALPLQLLWGFSKWESRLSTVLILWKSS